MMPDPPERIAELIELAECTADDDVRDIVEHELSMTFDNAPDPSSVVADYPAPTPSVMPDGNDCPISVVARRRAG
jgi:hypothetical protein